MKLVVNAYARSGARSADRTEKTAGKLRSAAAMVFVAGSGFFRSGVCGEVFDIPTVDEGGGAVPSFIAAVLPAETDSEIAVLKIDGDGRLTDGAAQCIHWDAGCFELCVLLNEKKRSEPEPARLGSVDFPTGSGRQRRVALFRDGGLRISVEESGQERSWYVCGGTDGKAHVLDIGRERLLVIHASGCRRCENSEAETPVLGFKCGCRCEKLVALNDKIEVAAALAGEICRIENGYLTAIEPLGTVLGHEKRTRYEFFGGSLRELPPETGFFTNQAHMPNSPRETALALMQAVRLGREDEADALLSRELAETLSFAELCDFFGSFADERIAPSGFCEPTAYDNSTAEKIIVGAIKTDANGLVRAEKFVFTIENGVVTDVEGED